MNFDVSEYAVANEAIVGLGGRPDMCINVATRNSAPGSSDVVLDVVGYVAP